jgi:hypothetical protein
MSVVLRAFMGAITMKKIRISLNEEACKLALGPYIKDVSLLPDSRAAIQEAPKSPLGAAVRDVSCTVEQARDMLDYYRSAADALTTIRDARPVACADAYQNIQFALKTAGV